ncbi:uncharacterized protein LOC134776803 [Penaeus indicus]|uniref:uncharacterized protein LOC134776803 n=1 Tax=Penaeus indicus TaxID=29960 RepID=UPI00300D6B0D
MDSEGRARSGANRSSSRRGPRSDWRSSNQSGSATSSANQYSSSDEDPEVSRNTGRGYRSAQRTDALCQSYRMHHLIPTRDRGSNRSRATTPLSHTSDPDVGDPPSLVSLQDAANAHHNNLSHYRGQYSTAGVGGGGVGGGDSTAAVMNQLSSAHGHYYQEIPQTGHHYANHLDEYDSPVVKGSRKYPQGRRMPGGGSSLSSK